VLGYITDPSAPGGLIRRELTEPDAGPGDVLVDVRAYAVNRGELRLLHQRPDGWRPGQDLAGIVARPAADGSSPPDGTRVVGLADGGAWSQRAVVPSHRVAPLPEGVSFVDAAALPVAGLTALRALRTGGPLLGKRVLITGASGGVGSFAVQLAKAGGARVTAHVSGPHRADAVSALGADDVVTELTDTSGPFDVALDGVGGTVLVDAIHRLAPGGTVVAYGVASGQPSALMFSDFGSAPLGRLVGFFVYATGEQTFGEDLATLAGFVAEGRLKVQAGGAWDWSRTADAVEAIRNRQVTGKVVLTIG
jgi:NADPH:quinone reductase